MIRECTEIGKYGFSHWSGKPVTPNEHRRIFVPQSAYDSWEAYCSCGRWMGIASSWDYPTGDSAIAALTVSHEAHTSAS
jgi:hypothetical protein